MKNKLLAVLFFLALPFFAQAKGKSVADRLAENISLKNAKCTAVLYDNMNGLPTSEANTIAEVSDNFIWIGSYNGLIRYDGSSFERINPTTGISNVVSLYVDSKKRLWVGTNDSGVALLEKGDIRMFNRKDGLLSLSARSIAENQNGDIYIATTYGLAVINSQLKLKMIEDPRITDEYIHKIQAGRGNEIIGTTRNGDIFIVRGLQISGYYSAKSLGIPDVHYILPDPQDPQFIYIGTSGSKLLYGTFGQTFEVKKELSIAPFHNINSMKIINGVLWLCTDSGIGIIKNDTFFPIKDIPLNTSIEEMTVDYIGNMWFASSQQGVMKITPTPFTDIYDKAGLAKEVVNATCLYDGKLFIGTNNNGLKVLKGDTLVQAIPIKKSMSPSGILFKDTDLIKLFEGDRIRCLMKDSYDRLWICTFGDNGLVCYANGIITKYTTADGMPSNRIRSVSERGDGAVMACCTGGVAIIKGGKVTAVYGENILTQCREALSAAPMNNGDMVVGTDGGGLYVIQADKVIHQQSGNGLSSDVILRVKKSPSKNILWLVTSNSLAYMTSDYRVTTIKGFPHPNNFDVYENKNGDLWILSSDGVYIASIDNLLENKEIVTVHYGIKNGLPGLATSNSYSHHCNSGDLYIATSTGVVKCNIEEPYERVEDFKMEVPFIIADNLFICPQKLSGPIELPSDIKKLTIHGHVFNYSMMSPLISYKLEGSENKAHTVHFSKLEPVVYTNLKGGEYHFTMQILDPHGRHSTVLDVPIIKQKAPKEIRWVQILCILFVFATISFIAKLKIDHRTRQFEKKEHEQRQLIREIVEAFAKIIDMKDKYTNGHSSRVAEYTAMLAREMGYDNDSVEKYYNAALLHDIGKVGIPPEVLNKPGKLTTSEYNIIKSHSAMGYETLKNISILPELAVGAGAHHERPDGKGYPKGLKGEEIPTVAKIIAVADTFDAMYSDRPYRKRMNFERAVSIIKGVDGSQLSSDVVAAFLRLVDKGYFKAPDDQGGGTTEDINNIRKKFDNE